MLRFNYLRLNFPKNRIAADSLVVFNLVDLMAEFSLVDYLGRVREGEGERDITWRRKRVSGVGRGWESRPCEQSLWAGRY